MKTKKQVSPVGACICALIAAVIITGSGCSKSAKDTGTVAPVPKPAEAASQLQQAFATAPVEVKQAATVASEALRTADYDKAMQSLQAMKARQNLTPQQRMAVHESEVAMVGRLITAMERGDLNAKLAYERYKKSRRE